MNRDEPSEVARPGAGFGIVDAGIIRDRTLTGPARLLYATLATYANQGRESFPSRRTLAESMGVSTDTVDRALDLLKDRGVVEVQERYREGQRATSLYVLKDLVRQPPPGQANPQEGRTRAARGAAPVRHRTTPLEQDQENTHPAPSAQGTLALVGPTGQASPGSPVQAVVAHYADAVKAQGGTLTTSVAKAVGANAKRLILVDGIPVEQVMEAATRAAARGSRTLDPFLVQPNGPRQQDRARQTAVWERNAAMIDGTQGAIR